MTFSSIAQHAVHQPYFGPELRKAKRARTRKPGILHLQGQQLLVQVNDLSVAGARLELPSTRSDILSLIHI